MVIDFKKVIEKIHEKQLKTIMPLTEFRKRASTKKLPAKSRGLYWLWCKTDFNQIKLATTSNDSAQVPIDVLYKTRNGLKMVCKEHHDGFKMVYNGMGGYQKFKKGSSYGLRARINQECVSNNKKTGTLNIKGRGLEEIDWKVSFFDFENADNDSVLKLLDPNPDTDLSKNKIYKDFANTLEILWRLHYGAPIFCRH